MRINAAMLPSVPIEIGMIFEPCRADRKMNLEKLFAKAQDVAREDPEALDFGQYQSLGCLYQYQVPIEMMQRAVPPGAEVLDWGCGGGHFAFTLTELGYRVTGFSLWREHGFIPYLESHADFSLIVGDLAEPRKLPFADESFDAVVSMGVLEHVRETGGDELASLKEIRRVLRPGGTLMCAHLPNRLSAIEWASRKRPKKEGQFTCHEYLYARSDIVRLCREAGLELGDHRLYNVLPRRVLNRVPGRNNRVVVGTYNTLDAILSVPFGALSQNWVFMARKPFAMAEAPEE